MTTAIQEDSIRLRSIAVSLHEPTRSASEAALERMIVRSCGRQAEEGYELASVERSEKRMESGAPYLMARLTFRRAP